MAAPISKAEFVGGLFDEQSQPLLKFLISRFHDREDAAEIAQEAWLRIYRLDNPETLRNPRAFLFQTASNLAIDRLRRGGLEKRYHDKEADEPMPIAPSAERDVAAQQDLAHIERALGELPLKCRQAFVMHRAHGVPYPVIADSLGVSVSMVEKYIIKALKHFRVCLGETPG